MPKALTGCDGPEGNAEAPVSTGAGRRAENLPLDMRSGTGAVTRNNEFCGVIAAARGARIPPPHEAHMPIRLARRFQRYL